VTSIPLADVVSFLRPRGALEVLEGAPWFTRYPTGDGALCPFSLTSAYTTPSAMELEAASPNKAMLYLGRSEVCPAAEGWASRVLAMARGVTVTPYIHAANPHYLALMTPSNGRRWDWDPKRATVKEDDSFYIDTILPGEPPPTPAERLAAVLRYELGRAR
jgi:hypothetical protein